MHYDTSPKISFSPFPLTSLPLDGVSRGRCAEPLPSQDRSRSFCLRSRAMVSGAFWVFSPSSYCLAACVKFLLSHESSLPRSFLFFPLFRISFLGQLCMPLIVLLPFDFCPRFDHSPPPLFFQVTCVLLNICNRRQTSLLLWIEASLPLPSRHRVAPPAPEPRWKDVDLAYDSRDNCFFDNPLQRRRWSLCLFLLDTYPSGATTSLAGSVSWPGGVVVLKRCS